MRPGVCYRFHISPFFSLLKVVEQSTAAQQHIIILWLTSYTGDVLLVLQAFGAGNFPMMSATLLRAQLVCCVAVLPTLVLWGSGRLAQLLPALGQQTDIAQPASR